ncbi:MAG: hypothetical protein HY826_02645 [Actinobacteria bacterium]|nr:hypothetical protein [Actinomycetota bacterium]
MNGYSRCAAAVVAAIGMVGLMSSTARADVHEAVDNDADNSLWECASRRVTLGDEGEDMLRCLTFRFEPPEQMLSAVLYLEIEAPTDSLQDTDSLVVAVDEPFEDCAWAQGGMPGCVVVHGGFSGGERSLVVDLLNIACDPAAPAVDAARQAAVVAALASGVLNMMLQDDTAVRGGWLDLNGASAPRCGTSVDEVPTAIVAEATTGGAGQASDGDAVTEVLVPAAGAALAVVVAATAGQRVRVRRARRRVSVRRVPDDGGAGVTQTPDPNQRHSIALGVRAWPDAIGTQQISEAME